MDETKVKFDRLKRPVLTEQDAINLLLEDKRIPRQSVISNDSTLHCAASQHLYGVEAEDIFYKLDNDISFDDFYKQCVSTWNIPQKYFEIDLLPHLLSKCTNDKQQERVCLEYIEFEKRNLLPLLSVLIFLVDYFRENNYVWGVGRGSSVASYILYLIEIHRIDSMLFELSIDEFLR